jgi:uncharacterized membrane protein YwzB
MLNERRKIKKKNEKKEMKFVFFVLHCLVVSTAWWSALLGDEHCLVVSTAWWSGRLGAE